MDHQPMPNHSIEIIPESSSPLYPKHTTPSSTNQSICATKYDQPTCSTTRNSISIGKMFFKTKLHSMLRSGTCPNVGNCSFAHREEYQIPILTSSSDWERSYKGKQCKKFYTDEGCPYGDMCSFLHDEKSKDRESVVINLSPNVGAGWNGCIQKHSNWKTRVCNKWEMTGYCPFGTKCNFAHGAEELHSHGGRVAEMETNNISSTVPDASIKAATTTVSSTISLPHANAHHIGVPGQRSNTINPRPIQRPMHKWKGPDKISRIYGDWIDDID